MAKMEDDIWNIVDSVNDREKEKRSAKKKPFHEDVDIERLLGRRLSEDKKVVSFGAQHGPPRPKRWMPPTPEQVSPRPIERQTQSAMERLSHSSQAQQAPREKLPTQMTARELAERARQKRESQAGAATISYSPKAQGAYSSRAPAPAPAAAGAAKPKRKIQFLKPEETRAMLGLERKMTSANHEEKKKRAEQARREFFASAKKEQEEPLAPKEKNEKDLPVKRKGGLFNLASIFERKEKAPKHGAFGGKKWAAREGEAPRAHVPEKEPAKAEPEEKPKAPVYTGSRKPIGAMLTRPKVFMPARKGELGAEAKRLAVLEEAEKKKMEPEPQIAPAKKKRKGFGLAGMFAQIAHKKKPKTQEEEKEKAEEEATGEEEGVGEAAAPEWKQKGRLEVEAPTEKGNAATKTFKKQEKDIGSSKNIDINTVLDEIYQIIEEKGSVKVSELSSRLGLTAEKIIQLATIFEESKKIEIEYPLFGSPKLVMKEKGETDE